MTVAYVTMPGTSGNYVSTADVNLFDADTAHLHQSAGQWTVLDVPTLSQDVTPVFGDYVAKVVGGANPASATVNNRFPATAGSTYSFGMTVWPAALSTGTSIKVSWFDAGFGLVSANNLVASTAATSGPVLLSGNLVAPASTAWAQIVFQSVGAGTGNPVYFDAVWMALGAGVAFRPSLRIVGDLDMRARMTATTATPASAETLIGQRSGNSGYAMTLGTGGELVVYHGTGSGTRAETSSGLSLVAATDTEVRSVIDISAGTWTHYKNGVQFDTSASFATTAGSPYAGPLAVGADSAGTSGNWDGDIYYAEVRDGIDGPVVRRMDADDLIGLV